MSRRDAVVVVEATAEARAARFAERFALRAAEAAAARGRFLCALTGGSTPSQLYPALREAAVPWARVHVFFGDERAVPAHHPDSNLRLARETLLARVPIPEDQVHALDGGATDLDEAARRATSALRSIAGDPPALDVVHLGVGPDGHVASLFPGHPALDDAEARVVPVDGAPKPPPRRLTMTLPVLLAAREVWLIATGDAKADVVRRALAAEEPALPVARLARRAQGTVVWFVDEAVAAALDAAA